MRETKGLQWLLSGCWWITQTGNQCQVGELTSNRELEKEAGSTSLQLGLRDRCVKASPFNRELKEAPLTESQKANTQQEQLANQG